MSQNNQTWVSPNGKNCWKIHHPGSERASGIFSTKQEAINNGRQISKNQRTEFIVQNKNGEIGFKDSHGPDKCPPKG